MPAQRLTGVSGILYVMAAEAEYGTHLKARISPLMTGVGPVEAGVAVTAELAKLQVQQHLPHLVVSLGSAGSARLRQVEVYQANAVSYRDMDASPFGLEPGVTPFLGLPAILPLGPLVPGIPQATLSTGANVVSGAAYEQIAADMVDMETYAVKRACDRFGLPLVALRGISDGAVEVHHVDDWRQYLHIIDEKLAAAVDLLHEAIAERTLEWPSLDRNPP